MLSRRTFAAVIPLLAIWGCDSGGGAEPPSADVGGPFELTDTSGARVDETILNGQWSAVYFGFSYCPDVCPGDLQALKAALDQLGRQGDEIQTVFITVDPERDTPEELAKYLDNPAFPDRIVGLTGSAEDIAEAARVYRVYYQKVGDGPDYTMQHQAVFMLMDPQGRFVRPLPHGLSPEKIATQIGDAMRQYG